MIPAVGPTAESANAHGPLLGVPRVLVVDEATPVIRALQEVLHRLGIPREDIVAASTAADALAWFKGEAPRIVFAEFIGVHNEDGLEVIHEMLERAPEAKIVLLTSEGRDSPEVRAALRAGIFAHIEKPIRQDKIRQVLQDLQSEEGGIERMR